MQLIENKPLEVFLDKTPKDCKALNIVSPFITKPGLKMIHEKFKLKRKMKLQILTNLGYFNLLMSMNDPIQPILDAMDLFSKVDISIKSNDKLHAKLFMADKNIALIGSSNLTMGGMKSNYELNYLIEGRKKAELGHKAELDKWFKNIWKKSGNNLKKADLLSLQKNWQENSRKVSGLIAGTKPEPALGGDHWGKINDLLIKKVHKRNDVARLLSTKDVANPSSFEDEKISRNYINKLIFLRDIGIVEKYNKDEVHIKKQKMSVKKMIKILEVWLKPSATEVLHAIKKNPGIVYKELEKEFNLYDDESIKKLHTIINWLQDMSKVKIERKGYCYSFYLTEDDK